MEVILEAIKLLTRALEAIKAYLDLRGSGCEEESDHPDAQEHRPKHLRE
ncbi:MAG: hypothetical protein IKG22_01755 [Atopobiaceae bacterium]|nr:hypothetical protein [Atopobiaceae bacterium]